MLSKPGLYVMHSNYQISVSQKFDKIFTLRYCLYFVVWKFNKIYMNLMSLFPELKNSLQHHYNDFLNFDSIF